MLDDMSGVAVFSTVEEQVELTIRLDSGKGAVEGRVRDHAVAILEFEAQTDQSYLRQTLADLMRVTTAFPARLLSR